MQTQNNFTIIGINSHLAHFDRYLFLFFPVMLSSCIRLFRDALFPRQCIHSGKKWSYLSKHYQRQLIAHPSICPHCKKISAHFFCHVGCRWDCFMQWCIIGFSYNHIIKKLITSLKYWHRRDTVDYLIDRLYFHVVSHPLLGKIITHHPETVCVTRVASHWWRKHIVKWYNQSEILAKKLAQQLSIPCIQLVKKKKKTASQVMLTRQERIDNVSWSFCAVHHRHVDSNAIRYVIVVDDIITTGSTLNEVAKTIQETYPLAHIWGAVLARNMK